MAERATILSAAEHYAEHHHDRGLTASPTRHIVVLTCMDARLDLFRILGLANGDAHILRNAGGRATDDAIRSLTLSTHWLGTREIVVIHHTGCGLFQVTNEQIRTRVAGATGHSPGFDFLPFDDVEQSVREDVARIAELRLLAPGCVVWGAVFDVHSGRLEPVGEVRAVGG